MESQRDKKRRPGRSATGKAMTGAERMHRLRGRRRFTGLNELKASPTSEPLLPLIYSSMRVADAKSLAMHAVVAQKLSRDPSLLKKARANLVRWSAGKRELPRWTHEWRTILKGDWTEVAALITEQSERAVRLRKSSPMAGLLTPQERSRILAAFRP
jgi:hypothetical protein